MTDCTKPCCTNARSRPLVLSCFPGIGLLDHAFEEEGFTVVRGPDLLWGGDVHTFHPPAGVFDGLIGGPPCGAHSPLKHMVLQRYGADHLSPDLIPEFARCVAEARPRWFVMENSRCAPPPDVAGYQVHTQLLNNRWLGDPQNRERRISFGTHDGRPLHIQLAALEHPQWEPAVTSEGRAQCIRYGSRGAGGAAREKPQWKHNHPRDIPTMLELQGFPRNLLDKCPFTVDGKRTVVANGVPRPMGQAIAQAVKRLMYPPNP